MTGRTALTHEGNVVAALAVALHDRIAESVEDTAGVSMTAAACLSSLADFLDAPSIDLLSRVVGLSHSATVRLVDRLEADRLVARSAGPDGRTVAVTITTRGKRTASAIARARTETVERALAQLTRQHRDEIDRAAGALLAALRRGPGATRWACRLCSTSACERDAGRCPVWADTNSAPPRDPQQ